MKILSRLFIMIMSLLTLFIFLIVLDGLMSQPPSSRNLDLIITIILNSKSILWLSFFTVLLGIFVYLKPSETPKEKFYTFQVCKINSMVMGSIESSYSIYSTETEEVICKDINETVIKFKELKKKLKTLKGNKNHEILIEFVQDGFIEEKNNYYNSYLGLTVEEQKKFYEELYKDSVIIMSMI